ncbi:Voltage Gated Calcium/Sodium Channel subunit alpha [Ectocarpus siliculosus]|uniref:Voltage Gated Calcium/Sodium Channel subunit alpha n=1 Tax=Ectocarpus siliculosus TaxID=2880 RepID=D7FVE6_ECTSI|nr:Voltage Gated Calcium/Sodium Channel subunit alpha [Ectocarpus siliculosus]|eukprot:CBJ26318.1 Voltage Gated Calcium/Sodium Channel subunit alpha [Ectocarpus siliculosus]
MIYPTQHHGAFEKGNETPGYDHSKEAVFKACGKTFKYAKTSLYVFDELNPVRVACVKTIAHPWFDRFILFLIVLNSFVLALTDWSVIDDDPNSPDVGEPIDDGSWRNALLFESEAVFTAFFTLEFVLKVIAQGFYLGRGSYLRDSWNILDFMVVVTALMTSIPGMPKMTAIRVFRVLRPLKSISALPGLQKLVVSMLRSVPQLVSVVILLQFIFTVFGIFGIQIFAGKQHSRCRLTPFPVNNSFEVGMNYTDYRCLSVSNFDVVDDEPSWTQSTSPWATPRECWWPIDSENERLCTSNSGSGKHKCEHDDRYMNLSEFRWCGSNYDALGNPRFAGGVIEGVEWGAGRLTDNATFVQSLNWGYTNFDNIFVAFLTIFQSITMEGWSDVLYQVKDCSLPILGDVFFIILILWGSFFTLNLLLAVLEGNFTKGKEDDKEAEERHRQALWADEGTNGASFIDENEEEEGGGVTGNDELQDLPTWRLVLRRLVDHVKFQNSITLLIVLNTLVLALDHHPMDEEFSTYLEVFNFAFSLCFMLEMALKVAALGPREYAKDNFNLFDGFIVISGLLELILSPPDILTGETGNTSGGALSALRSFRLFRVFKLAREWHSMRELLNTLGKTLLDIGNFGMLLVLFMYIYALVGLQFFANRFHFNEVGEVVGIGEPGYYTAEVPRSNFDTLMNAFTTIFEILSGENWNTVMYDARRATGWVSVFYFVSLIIMGMMIVMNLFLAILLSNFTNKDDVDAEAGGGSGNGENAGPPVEHPGSPRVAPYNPVSPPPSPQRPKLGSSKSLTKTLANQQSFKAGGDGTAGKLVTMSSNVGRGSGDGNEIKVGSGRPRFVVRAGQACRRFGADMYEACRSAIFGLRVPDDLDPGKALFVLGPDNKLRQGCAAVVHNPGFDRFILLLISVSSLALALDSPLRDPESATAKYLKGVERVMTALFFIEMALKICAHGFALMPKAYLRSAWNILDFVVVVISMIQLVTNDSGNLESLRSLRTLRALRPLRMINRAPGLKIVLNALFAAIPDVLNVAAVCFMFFIIFAILGVNYFKGILMSCQGEEFDALPESIALFIQEPTSWDAMSADQQSWFGPLSNVSAAFSMNGTGGFTTASACGSINAGWPDSGGCCTEWPSSASSVPTSYQLCECLGLDWDQTVPQQFDNVAQALLTFFEISTTEAWTSVMYAAVDATDVDMQPIRDNRVMIVWFFMLFMLIGSYLVMNLFVGVIIDNFNKMKSKAEGDGVLVTEEQQSWIKTQHMTHRLRPLKRVTLPGDPVGNWCYKVSHHKWFDASVMICIVLNTIVMAMQFFGQGNVYTRCIEGANYSFSFIFTVEAIIKILAFRRAYFIDPWNRFDIFIVIGTNLGLAMLWMTGRSYGSIATIIRTFRIGRVLRLVRGLESMAQLFNTLLLTLPSLGNVGALLFLQFFIYAVMGVQLFATVGLRGAVDEQANFQTFWGSMVLLLRFSTGENWNGFMYDMVAEREDCVSNPVYDPDMCGFTSHANCTPLNGCGSWSIFPYMISFTLTITYVFMNLFIGVILDGFDAASASDHDVIKQEDFARFASHWAEFDPRATCLISVQDLHDFLQTLFAPWGFGKDYQASDREVRAHIRRLKLRIFNDNKVHFKDVLLALSEEVHRLEAEKKGATIDLPQYFQAKLATGWQKTSGINSHDYMVNPVSGGTVTLDHILAAEFIQKAFRRFLEFRRSTEEQRQRTQELEPAGSNMTSINEGRGGVVGDRGSVSGVGRGDIGGQDDMIPSPIGKRMERARPVGGSTAERSVWVTSSGGDGEWSVQSVNDHKKSSLPKLEETREGGGGRGGGDGAGKSVSGAPEEVRASSGKRSRNSRHRNSTRTPRKDNGDGDEGAPSSITSSAKGARNSRSLQVGLGDRDGEKERGASGAMGAEGRRESAGHDKDGAERIEFSRTNLSPSSISSSISLAASGSRSVASDRIEVESRLIDSGYNGGGGETGENSTAGGEQRARPPRLDL